MRSQRRHFIETRNQSVYYVHDQNCFCMFMCGIKISSADSQPHVCMPFFLIWMCGFIYIFFLLFIFAPFGSLSLCYAIS